MRRDNIFRLSNRLFGGHRQVAAAALVVAWAMFAAPASQASPTHRGLLLPTMHTCDFQTVSYVAGRHEAQVSAEITTNGRTAVAHVDVADGADDAVYTVRLIPSPHSALGCLAGEPGITTGAVRTDGAGMGEATLQTVVAPGTSGLWVAVDLPSAHSQTPAEFYSSSYIAAV